jgi:hypothetical protein
MAVRAHAERLLRGRMHRILACSPTGRKSQEQSIASRFGWSGSRPGWSVARHGTRPSAAEPKTGRAQTRGQKRWLTPLKSILMPLPFSGKGLRSIMLGSVAPRPTSLPSTLDECIRQFTLKPMSQLHLYEIHTAPQGELIAAVLSPQQIIELAAQWDFL